MIINEKMEIIIIYGPPASGKTTVTKELCKITRGKFILFKKKKQIKPITLPNQPKYS